jgi:hypothetical protein
MGDRGLLLRAIIGDRIQGRCRTLYMALAAVWTVKIHAMAQGDQKEGRSWRR